MKSLTRIILLMLLAASIVHADDITKVGTTSAKFLAIGAGARAVSMGGAFVATANDATALYWNPSGITELGRPELIVNQSRWLADINFTYLGVVLPLANAGAVGLSVTAMTMDEMKVTKYGVTGDYTGETFKVGSYALGVSYARRLTNNFAIGGTAKLINEVIEQASATGLAVDVGTLFQTPFWGVRMGVSMSNFGSKMKMSGDNLLIRADVAPNQAGNNGNINAILDTDAFDLPLLMRIGLAKDFIDTDQIRLTIEVDGVHPNDNSEYINTGFELAMNLLGGTASLRGGLKSLYMANSEEEFTVGGGVAFPVGGISNLGLDYAYESWRHLGLVQKFSLQLGF
ncbi:PorV/PorQ family protein [Candidatus Neomarinimicrobiota bacterium]